MKLHKLVRLLAKYSEWRGELDAALVLFTLSGALKSPPGAKQELSRICTNFSMQVLKEMTGRLSEYERKGGNDATG